MLLPIPSAKYIPQYDRSQPLTDKIDEIFSKIMNEIINLKHVFDPFACDAKFLEVFGHMLNSFSEKTDTENIKRQRIWSAIQDNKLFGTWVIVKEHIDEICKGDAELVFQTPDDIWLLSGDGDMTDRIVKPTWAVMGLDEQSAQLDIYGIALEGVPIIWQKGMYYINVDNDHLTQDEIDLLYKTLVVSTPVGMTIIVGYLVGTNVEPYFVLGA